VSTTTKKEMTRLEKHMRAAQARKQQSKDRRAVEISIEGKRMAI
jgi:hypothetical protein